MSNPLDPFSTWQAQFPAQARHLAAAPGLFFLVHESTPSFEYIPDIAWLRTTLSTRLMEWIDVARSSMCSRYHKIIVIQHPGQRFTGARVIVQCPVDAWMKAFAV